MNLRLEFGDLCGEFLDSLDEDWNEIRWHDSQLFRKVCIYDMVERKAQVLFDLQNVLSQEAYTINRTNL